MATIQLYRSDISRFAAAVSAIANAVPMAPTFTTAATTAPTVAAVYAADGSGSYYVVSGAGLTYDAVTGLLTGGMIGAVEYHGMGASAGSFAVFSIGEFVSTLLRPSTQADPVGTVLAPAINTIISDTATLVAPGTGNTVQVGDTINSRIDAGAGISTAIFSAFRGDATVTGGGGTETVVVAGITTQLVSTERMQFLDGSVVESPGSTQGQAVLAFKGIFGRVPDAINAGGYAQAARFGVGSAIAQMLGTAEAQANVAGLDNGQFVTRIYQNVLGRAPSDAELTAMRTPLDTGRQTRTGLVLNVVTSSEAATASAGVFGGSGVFAASAGAVDVLRAYEVLLGRLPEASSLAANGSALDQYYAATFSTGIASKSLPDLYRQIQTSTEFAARTTPNPYGLTAGSSFGAVFAATHSDGLTATNTSLITAVGGVPHLVG